MPTIIPSYVYSLFAALIVGSIIVSACSSSVSGIRNEANTQQLGNIDEYVATQSLNLITHTAENNQNSTQYLEIPSSIGNQQFWICIGNNSSGAWVQSGFGNTAVSSQPQMHIPAKVAASGIFISGSGRAFLQCHLENEVLTLTLNSE
jgi:hypothetical protein